jgi:hypothetical protein
MVWAVSLTSVPEPSAGVLPFSPQPHTFYGMTLPLPCSALALLLLSSCSLMDGMNRAKLVSQRLEVKGGKELLTRSYIVDGSTGKTFTETLEVKQDIFLGLAANLQPQQPERITRDQAVRAVVVAIQRSSLELPESIQVQAEAYQPVTHAAAGVTSAQPLADGTVPAVGSITGIRKGSSTAETAKLYLDPVNGACLLDAAGQPLPWESFASIQLATL